MFERFKVSPFIPRPWQCFKCQAFGHNTSNCTGADKCVSCSENHSLENCPYKKQEGNEVKKCSNCHGKHTANYGGCEKMKKEKEVQQVRVKQNVSYRDAVKIVYSSNTINENYIPTFRVKNR